MLQPATCLEPRPFPLPTQQVILASGQSVSSRSSLPPLARVGRRHLPNPQHLPTRLASPLAVPSKQPIMLKSRVVRSAAYPPSRRHSKMAHRRSLPSRILRQHSSAVVLVRWWLRPRRKTAAQTRLASASRTILAAAATACCSLPLDWVRSRIPATLRQ